MSCKFLFLLLLLTAPYLKAERTTASIGRLALGGQAFTANLWVTVKNISPLEDQVIRIVGGVYDSIYNLKGAPQPLCLTSMLCTHAAGVLTLKPGGVGGYTVNAPFTGIHPEMNAVADFNVTVDGPIDKSSAVIASAYLDINLPNGTVLRSISIPVGHNRPF